VVSFASRPQVSRPLLVYLHGFNSSPQSAKAQATRSFINQHHYDCDVVIPRIHVEPQSAIDALSTQISREVDSRNVVLIGSSLGGYYAHYLAEQFNLKAALVNPAVRPFELLHHYIGINKNYHTDETFELKSEHLNELKALYRKESSHPDDYLVLLRTGDETLDYRQAAEQFKQSRLWITQGGDHGFQHWEAYLPEVLKFLGIKKSNSDNFMSNSIG
jgi:predicted esterase YcpF (UPF0227 family)